MALAPYADSVRVRWIWLSLVAVCSCCAGAGPENPENCPGEAPLLEDCFTGRNFAECGGAGDDVFACDFDDYDCRWFVGGCMPAGYLSSTCPADDICCHDDFPYALDDEITYDQVSAPWDAMINNGRQTWSRGYQMLVAVRVDPSLDPAATELACEGGFDEGQSPCENQRVRGTAGDLTMLKIGDAGLAGNYVTIELDGNTARACALPYGDAVGTTCPTWDEVDCAAGTVVVNQVVDVTTMAGTVDLNFASGAHVGGTFRVE